MATLEDGWIVQVRFVMHTTDQVGLNVRNYRVTNIVGISVTDQAAAIVLDTLFNPLYKAVLSAGASWRGVSVQKIWPTPRLVAAIMIGNAGPGSVAGDMLPSQVSGLISLRTAESGRNARGRNYVPFPSESSSDVNGLPTTAYQTNLQLIADNMHETITVGMGADSADIVPVVSNTPPTLPKDITEALARKEWGTQRKRGSFGRKNVLPF